MGDRLDVIQEMVENGLKRGPDDRYYRLFQLVLEELHYLRDRNATAKHAAQEFARLTP